MHTANDSAVDATPADRPERSVADALLSAFDKLWPHLAAWGLAGLLAFFAVRERITIMESAAQRHGERISALEQTIRDRDAEVGGIRDDTTRIRTLLEGLIQEATERRQDERARIRELQRQQQGARP